MGAWRVGCGLMAGLLLLHPVRGARAAGEETSTARPLVTIIGELTYREHVALPVGASLLVTLSEQGAATGPDAPTLARSRIDLAGQQVPLRFRLTAAAGRLKAGQRYALRATIHDGQGRPLWSIQSAHVIDPGESLANLGTLWLTQAPSTEPAAAANPQPERSIFQCGERQVVARFRDGGVELGLDGASRFLPQALAASGARFAGNAEGRSIEFWNKGRTARLTIDGQTDPECVETDTPDADQNLYEARGYGPAWTLRIAEGQVDLVRFGTGRSEVARFSLPERQLLADGYRYVTRLGDDPLRVTINPGLCLDARTSVPLPDRVTLERGDQVQQGCGGSPAAPLQQGSWRVEMLSGTVLPAGADLTLQFMPNGDVIGSSGCNHYSARYRADIMGLSIASAPGAGPLITCTPDRMPVEQAFLAALRRVERHTMTEDGALVLTGTDDTDIRLRRVEGP